ncbi:MAG: DNA-processing protein DprA [bacterium]|nr:DNA-processing protein DprA [bacterium]
MKAGTLRTDGAAAWLGLALLPALGPRQALRMADHLGGPAAVLGSSDAALRSAGMRDAARTTFLAARDGIAARIRDEVEALERAQAVLIAWDDAAYPEPLRTLPDPPLVLAVRGDVAALAAPAVAIVGARRCSDYGRRVAGELARALAGAGLVVVSGLAAGIDAAAHRGALEAGGRTTAVLGTGIDRVYPAWHRPLARQVAGQGALVSELPCGAPALPHHFPRRNRVVSGLALGTVVVEAAERSGSLGTARLALEQGREVFAVPGPVGVAGHVGCHRLIQEGAQLVTGAADVLAVLAPALVPQMQAARAAAEAAALGADERAALAALEGGPAHVDDVIRTTGLGPQAALETLLALELRGLVEQRPGMRFARRWAA